MISERMQLLIEYRDTLLQIKELENEILGIVAVTKPAEEKLPEPEEKPVKKIKIDKGKILALAKAGWKGSDIARDVKCSENTVYKILKEARNERTQD